MLSPPRSDSDGGTNRSTGNRRMMRKQHFGHFKYLLLLIVSFALLSEYKYLTIENLISFRDLSSLSSPSLAVSVSVDQQVQQPPEEYAADGSPVGLVVHGKRDKYTAVPEEYHHKVRVTGKGKEIAAESFTKLGWEAVKKYNHAHVVYHPGESNSDSHLCTKGTKPWQRCSRVPGFDVMDSKDGFLAGFRKYKQSNPDFRDYFLPLTFRLKEESDRILFQHQLYQDNGLSQPWVLKNVHVNNGQGIEMLGPNSQALETAVSRAMKDEKNEYIVQQYVCNELTWFQGEKFDLRFYWVVASIDPIIVLYHDGYVRAAAGAYNETDFLSTDQHLTNHGHRIADESQVTHEHLWKRIREHYQANKERLSKIITIDPVDHVRSQMKEAIGATVSSFKDVSFGSDPMEVNEENLFGFHGADFIIDDDLDVWFIEVQKAPGGQSEKNRKSMFERMFQSMLEIVQEIQDKQVADPQANILPLEKKGDYEVVYAGDWQYTYRGYERSTTKSACSGGSY